MLMTICCRLREQTVHAALKLIELPENYVLGRTLDLKSAVEAYLSTRSNFGMTIPLKRLQCITTPLFGVRFRRKLVN